MVSPQEISSALHRKVSLWSFVPVAHSHLAHSHSHCLLFSKHSHSVTEISKFCWRPRCIMSLGAPRSWLLGVFPVSTAVRKVVTLMWFQGNKLWSPHGWFLLCNGVHAYQTWVARGRGAYFHFPGEFRDIGISGSYKLSGICYIASIKEVEFQFPPFVL